MKNVEDFIYGKETLLRLSRQYLKVLDPAKFVDKHQKSKEYDKIFGEDTVPHMRSWNSPIGLKTKSFLETASITKAFATSDNCKII